MKYIYNIKLAQKTIEQLDKEIVWNKFKESYEKKGPVWEKEKFMSRAKGWEFWGDDQGWVSVRPQLSGGAKLVGVAGNPKSILKGIKDLLEAYKSKPLWGLVSKNIRDMAIKLGLETINKEELKNLNQSITGGIGSGVLGGGSILGATDDGGVIINYPDIGKTTKYFIGNSLGKQKTLMFLGI